MKFPRLSILVLFTLLPLPGVAQEPSAEFSDLVEVSEVLLDVLVTDRKGNVILGLEAGDFEVEDDGRPVTLTGVSFYSNRFLLEEGQERIQHPKEVLADRYFILVLHDQRRRDSDRNRFMRQQMEASRESQRWVREEMLPGDWVAVASYDVKLKVHQDFTQNREALVDALKAAALGKDPGNIWPSRRNTPEGQPSLTRHLPQGKDLRRETTRIYDALRLLAEASREISARKSMLLFTTGFGRQNGSNPFAEADPRYYPALEHALNDNNVAVYPIDLTPIEFIHLQSDFLHRLANDSGGFYHEKFVSFLSPMRQIADENNGYYLLSYQAEHPAGESGYRKVKVKAKSKDLKLRFRRGYLFGSGEESGKGT